MRVEYAAYDINSPGIYNRLSHYARGILRSKYHLAKLMQDNFSNKLKRTDMKKLSKAGFYCTLPELYASVLVETGFIGPNKDERCLF